MSQIILTKGVKEYRQTIPYFINKNDIVLEIGCAWGTTRNLLYKHAKYLVAIDKGKSLPTAKKKYPYIHFEQIDGFNIEEVINLGFKFNKIYIDISGCRSMFDVIRMAKMYESVFKPEIIVVKSSNLRRFASSCVVWDRSKPQKHEPGLPH